MKLFIHRKSVLHIVFVVCLHSLLLGKQNAGLELPSPWQEVFESLGFWAAEL